MSLVLIACIFILSAPLNVMGDRFCGVDLENARALCWQPCSSDSDCCSPFHTCFEASSCGSSNLSGTNHNFCGVDWCDAAYKCGTPCPTETECTNGEHCFADIPCDSDTPKTAPSLPAPPTTAPYQFCGNSISNARDHCWQPCPRGDSDCCLGLRCFDTSEYAYDAEDVCTNSDYSGTEHNFCGSSWCQAAYSCLTACPGGSDAECPEGTYCYADVPCTRSTPPPEIDSSLQDSPFSSYCGVDETDAKEKCWQPCRDNDDCCLDQECIQVSTCAYPDHIGTDHSFCGTNYCDAANRCHMPCPLGWDAECPDGERCIHNTPCNANMRLATTRTLKYGLPVSVHDLFRSYDPREESQTNSETQTTQSSESILIGLVFAMCLV